MPVPIDVERARRETPGCTSVVHLDNAGAALPPRVVTETVVAHVQREAAIGGYRAAAEADDRAEAVYDSVAALLGCGRHEVALTESATTGWQAAMGAMRFGPGDRIVTGRAEYASNVIAFLHLAGRTGAEIDVIDDDEAGQIDLDALASRLDGDVKLVALTHVPTSGGLVNPAAEVGRLTRAAGVPYLLDACQSAGQLPTLVDDLGCDVLAAAGRKFLRGPRGTGFLYVREAMLDRLEPPLLDQRSATPTGPGTFEVRADARRFETFEHAVAARLGLGAAVDHALGWGLDAIEERVTALAEELRRRLGDVAGVGVHDQGRRRCGIVTFSVDGVPAATVVAQLLQAGIATKVVSAASAQLDLASRGLPDLVRASVHYYNTDDELDRLVAALPSG